MKEAELKTNFRRHFETLNCVPLSEGEFARLLEGAV